MDADAENEGRTQGGQAGPGEWLALSRVACRFGKGFTEKDRDHRGVGAENSPLLQRSHVIKVCSGQEGGSRSSR